MTYCLYILCDCVLLTLDNFYLDFRREYINIELVHKMELNMSGIGASRLCECT